MLCEEVVRVRHVSYSDGLGGADISAYRIHQSVQQVGVQSSMVVAIKQSNDPSVTSINYRGGLFARTMRQRIGEIALWTQKSTNPVHRSINIVPSGALGQIEAETDIVHLHWVGSDTLSIAEIGRINRPIVWNLHDSWPFTGAEHHPETFYDRRFEFGYMPSNRNSGSSRFDLDRWVWRRKTRQFPAAVHLVAPSHFMLDQAQSALLSKGWSARVIPNPVDTSMFSPGSRVDARRNFGLPLDAPILLAGAFGGVDHTNKGWDLFQPALSVVRDQVPDAHIALFGAESNPRLTRFAQDTALPIHTLGVLTSTEELALAYRAADAFVTPSRMESFSQTAAEAQSCGIPVVAFATSGLLDVVRNGETGYLVTPFDSKELGQRIVDLLISPTHAQAMGRAGAGRAAELWSYARVGQQFAELYDEVGPRNA